MARLEELTYEYCLSQAYFCFSRASGLNYGDAYEQGASIKAEKSKAASMVGEGYIKLAQEIRLSGSPIKLLK